MQFRLPLALAALVLAIGGIVAFFLTDGGVRRATHKVLARRLGGVFRPRLVVVGDSLAAGCPWPKLDERPFASLNLAEGGATLKQIAGQVNYARDFADASLLIDGGLNDLLYDQPLLEHFEADCRALFRRIGAHEQVIVTLMPYTADPAFADMIDAGNEILSRLGADRGFSIIDLNETVSWQRARKPEMTNDGLHFTRPAELYWIQKVRAILR
jgi:lysophospholipase L1-like esterase